MMKKLIWQILCFGIAFIITLPTSAMANKGDSGYEGGISSGTAPGKTVMRYKEVSFITGEPIVFEGSLTIKKSNRQDMVNTTYTYSLKNEERLATLTRTLNYSTKITKHSNDQSTEDTIITGKPSEIVKIDGKTYTMSSYEYSRSHIIDSQPAIDYFAGSMWGRKIYQTGLTGGTTVSVESTGRFYGYDQYWGTAEAQIINYVIEAQNPNGEQVDSWGGTAEVTISSTTSKQLEYMENQPQIISFEGGYTQSQNNSNIMEYTARFQEFDSKGVATDYTLETSDTLKLDSLPQQTSLPVPDLSNLRGHWSEEDVKALYSLKVFKEDSSLFNPEEYITKAEFVAAMVEAAKEVPKDEDTKASRPVAGQRNKKEEIISPFFDVEVDSKYFTQIDSAYKRGMILGKGDGTFGASDYLTMADALTIFIKSIGLESLAPGIYPVTTFRDNDEIPEYARRAAFVAQKIGLIRGDTSGSLNPGNMLTKAQAAAMINRFISYMREDIRRDYRERIMAYR